MSLFKRKKPWVELQHEEQFIPKNYSEEGVDHGAKLENQLIGNVDLERIHSATKSMALDEIMEWLDQHREEFDESTFIVNTDDGKALETLKGHHPRLIINKLGLTHIRHLNTFLNKANETMVDGGYLWCHSRTSGLKKQIILRSHPGFIGKVLYLFHYGWHPDLMNIFGGFKPNRVFDIDAYAGGGVVFGFAESGNVHDASFNAGLMNTLRLTDQLRLLLNIRGALIGDAFDGEAYTGEPTKQHWLGNHKFDGQFGATLGLTYNIGKEYSKWRLAERTSVYQYDKETIEKIVKEVVEVEKEVAKPEVPEVWFHINFIIDRWDISKKELINIHAVSDLIKSTPNTKYPLR